MAHLRGLLSGELNRDTACICSRMKSATINLPAKGDKLRPGHAANIGKALTGRPKSQDHRKALSEATKGVPKAAWSEERKAARREQRRAQEVAKRTGKGVSNGAA